MSFTAYYQIVALSCSASPLGLRQNTQSVDAAYHAWRTPSNSRRSVAGNGYGIRTRPDPREDNGVVDCEWSHAD
ncbi:MAG: hypothetical protein QME41_06535 [Actinomycetota bacterium]|nr:hypothetical protein [Actinomycetota bacterium]